MGQEHVVEAMGHEHVVKAMGHESVRHISPYCFFQTGQFLTKRLLLLTVFTMEYA